MSPFVLAGASAILFVASGAGFVLQILSANATQVSGLAMQGGMSLLWGAMALRFWTRGRIAKQLERERKNASQRPRT